ncbi:hypothetical protein TBK1r_66000 [Stieleria magnilauensis]|uniref:Uncharacterized protein n=1 Tax=Stieleria magnilauensis TaxID=2527963 RepID=A0ABX5XZV2_9BACT|nr:hypothetical protein TBK1r_66000 [Planctomycetes bacterium TBK1r]
MAATGLILHQQSLWPRIHPDPGRYTRHTELEVWCVCKYIGARNLTDTCDIQATCDSCDDLINTHFKPPGTVRGAAWSKE